MVKPDVTVSVVIPNLNSRFIHNTLAALRAQQFDMGQVEVLVVGLDDPGLVQADDPVRLLSTGEPVSPAIARNIGIKAAQGQIICFTDADCLPAPDWLKQLVQKLSEPQVQVVGGGVLFEAQNYWSWCDNLSWFHEFLASAPAGPRGFLPSLNLAVRRPVIEAVGLFDEGYPQAGGEDADWTLRMRIAGFPLHFEPAVVVTHVPNRTTFRKTWQHSFTYGCYSTKINPKYRAFLQPSIFLTFWPLLALLTPLLAASTTWRAIRHGRLIKQAWLAGPGIYLGKVAWCLGAIAALSRSKGQAT
jgi:GT2 family glycosyltransferase